MATLSFLHGSVCKISRAEERFGRHIDPSQIPFLVNEHGFPGFQFFKSQFGIPVLALEENLAHVHVDFSDPVLFDVQAELSAEVDYFAFGGIN